MKTGTAMVERTKARLFWAAVCLMASLPVLGTFGCSSGSPGYAGTWVFQYVGKNFIVLTLNFADGHYTGMLAMPKTFQMAQGGDFTDINPVVGKEKIGSAGIAKGHLQFTTKDENDENKFSMILVDHDHATLELVGFPLAPWKLLRAGDSTEVTVATDWPSDEPKSPSTEISALQAKLKAMAEEDQAARKAQPISDSQVQRVDDKHYPELVRIDEKYGWPAVSVVGKKAASAYWLLVQHQDTHLAFQQRVLKVMQRASNAGEASKTDYAYLYDRVLTNEGKLQHWGTQTTCKNGKPVVDPVDDAAGLAQRRSELQLMPLDEYLKTLEPLCTDSISQTRMRKN